MGSCFQQLIAKRLQAIKALLASHCFSNVAKIKDLCCFNFIV